MAGEYDTEILCVGNLIDASGDDGMKYCYIQVFHARSDHRHVVDDIT